MLFCDQDGDVLPLIRYTLNFTAFEAFMNGTLVGNLDDAIIFCWASLPEDLGNWTSNAISTSTFEKRTNLHEWVSYVLSRRQYSYEYLNIADGLWQLGYGVYRMTSMGECSVVAGNKGMFYYKYYPVVGECNSTVHQKTIAGDIQYAIRKLEGDYLCNIYLFDVGHNGTWYIQIMIGPIVIFYTTSSKTAVYKGCYSEGCAELHSPPYICSLKEEG